MITLATAAPPCLTPRLWKQAFWNRVPAVIIGWAAFSEIATGASTVQSFSAATNDRFANNAAFVGTGFDFSGVGRDSAGKWGVMLNPSVFLSANHAAPSGSLIFYPGNDPAATPTIISISAGQQIGVSDFYIGTLSSPIPSYITSYSYLGIPLTDATFGFSVLANLPVFMGGISPSGITYGSASRNQVIGTNRIEGFAAGVGANIPGASDIVYTVGNQSGDSFFGYNHTTYETQLNGGDSGSPLLAFSGSNLIVVGTALGIGTGDIDGGPGVASRGYSAYTYTGNYTSAISSYISAVPEPAVSIFPAIFAFGMCYRERWLKKSR